MMPTPMPRLPKVTAKPKKKQTQRQQTAGGLAGQGSQMADVKDQHQPSEQQPAGHAHQQVTEQKGYGVPFMAKQAHAPFSLSVRTPSWRAISRTSAPAASCAALSVPRITMTVP